MDWATDVLGPDAPIVAGVLLVMGFMWGVAKWVVSRRDARYDQLQEDFAEYRQRSDARYDQLQEDFTAFRMQAEADRAAHALVQGAYRVLEDYAVGLRKHIDRHDPPPPPPWPAGLGLA